MRKLRSHTLAAWGQSFFFSSRRRHTRCLSDWSSDVCSSDLEDCPVQGQYRCHRAFPALPDRKSTRLNSSHLGISYAVFCLKKKQNTHNLRCPPPIAAPTGPYTSCPSRT